MSDDRHMVIVRCSEYAERFNNSSSFYTLVAWLSGSALISINAVTLLRRARLILGWVTLCGRIHHLCM